MIVESATADDLRRIAAIEREAFSDPWSERSFADLLGEGAVYFACARADAGVAPVGYVVAWFAADEGEIANIAVAPESRRAGIGAVLLDAALVEASRRGTVAVYLEVRESNVAARALYASRGFVEVGRRRGYYRRPVEDALVLRVAIPGPVAAGAGAR